MQQPSMSLDVSQLIATYQMGQVQREYKNTARTTMLIGIILTVVGGACMLLSLVLFETTGFNRLESYLFFLGLALLGYGITRIRAAGRNRRARVYHCTEGLLRIQGSVVEAIRWEQVRAVQKIFTSMWGISSLNRYMLYQPDFKPLVLDKTFDGFKMLGAEIEREVTRHLLPGAIAAYETGHVVSFGPISVTLSGLSVQAGRKILPWEDLGEIYEDNGFITIKKRGALLTWEKLSISQMLNLCVFLPLIQHIREGNKDKPSLSDQPPPPSAWQYPQWQDGSAQAGYPSLMSGQPPLRQPYVPLPRQLPMSEQNSPPRERITVLRIFRAICYFVIAVPVTVLAFFGTFNVVTGATPLGVWLGLLLSLGLLIGSIVLFYRLRHRVQRFTWIRLLMWIVGATASYALLWWLLSKLVQNSTGFVWNFFFGFLLLLYGLALAGGMLW